MPEKESFYQRYLKKFSLSFFLLLISIGALLVFAAVAHEVLGEKEDSFDYSVLNYLSVHVVTPKLTSLMEAITFLASGNFLLIAYPVLIYFYWYKEEKRRAFEILLIGVIGFLINYFMKLIYHRLRPANPLVDPLHNFSFPSGHATSAFVFYGLLICLVWQMKLPKPARVVIASFLFLLAFAIGFSRVYLRLHYPSDVLAGFCIGFVWISSAIWLLKRLK